jgi:SNF2 family DNA or RNA helicase
MAFVGTLYPFQEEAVERMLERQALLVGYEMGLGKTVITIAAVERLIEKAEVGGGLIIVPASLKYQWKRQIEFFTGGEAISLVIDGTKDQRELQYRRILAGEIEYAILNYEQVVRDWEIVQRLPKDFVVIDEATYIKSFTTKRSRRIKSLMRRCPYRFALTGQPIENRPEEIFSIMQAVDDEVLGRSDLFDKTFIQRNGFGGVAYYKNLPTLHEKLQEAMVRRTREDVKDQLPDVMEESILIDFDAPGAKVYRHMVRDLRAVLAEAMGSFGSFNLLSHYGGGQANAEELQARGQIMSRLTCLRMLCDNPELVRISAAQYDGTFRPEEAVSGSMNSGSAYASELKALGLLKGNLGTPKLDATMELIEEILEASPKNKVVLFSFFKENLRTIKRTVQALADNPKNKTFHGVESVLFMGDMNAKERDANKQRFTDEPDVRLFLSSDAGGYGVDLPMANFLISYDLPWSAGKWDQRNARIIRLSSEFPEVTLISMLMTGSIEEWQYGKLMSKQAIASAIIDGKGIDKQGRLNLNLASLTEVLDNSTV